MPEPTNNLPNVPTRDVSIAPGVSLSAGQLTWRFARSSGPGGQNVNKLNTKATMIVQLADLDAVLGDGAARRLRTIAGRFIVDDTLRLTSEASRSQHANRQVCLDKLRGLVIRAQVRPKKRKPTRPTRGSKERRIKAKKHRGEIKRQRQNPRGDH